MSEPPEKDPIASAEQFAEMALGRSSWVRLSPESEGQLSEILRAGWSRAGEEGRQDEWDDRVSSLVNVLIGNLGARGFVSGIEYKDNRPRDDRRPLPPEAFSDILRSLCPGFWPFC